MIIRVNKHPAANRIAYGKIVSDWKITPDGTFQWHVRIPANSFATVEVPAIQANAVKLNGHNITNKPGIKFVAFVKGRAIYRAESGTYDFTAPLSH